MKNASFFSAVSTLNRLIAAPSRRFRLFAARYKIFALFVPGILFLLACSKDNPSSPGHETVKRIRSVVTLNSNGREDFFYDSQGRLIEERDQSGYRTTYVYSDTKITENKYKDDVFQYSFNWILNNRGLVAGADFPNGGSFLLEYDNEDRLVKATATQPNGSVSTVDFIYSGGNCIKSQNSPYNSYTVSEYRLGDKNTLSNENYGKSYFGKDSKNLVQSETFTNSDGSKVYTFYDYDLDSEGYVIKQYVATYYPNDPNPFQSQIAYYYE